MKKDRFVIIDSHALIHRAYHAIPPLTTKDGAPVNAVYGFTSILLNVIKELKPKYLAAAFDLPGKTKRHEEYKEYKANRSEAPDELVSQFEIVHEVVRAFNIPILTAEGYEADDVIGTVVKKIPKNVEGIIVTGDLDELQLVNDNVRVYTMKRGFSDTVIYDEPMIYSRFGLTPNQFIDYKALKGDPSDNIPGVPGVGEKTATSLITEYGTLEEIYNNLDLIKPALAKKLKESKDLAILSKKLATIKTDLDIEIVLEKCLLHDYDRNEVFNILSKLEFKSLLARLPESSQKKDTNKSAAHDDKITRDYRLIDTEKKLKNLVAELKTKSAIAFDTETNSLSEVDAQLVGMSFSYKKGQGYYLPFGHSSGKNLDLNKGLKNLKPILESPKIAKVGHNIKFDYVVLKKYNLNLAPIEFDTMIAAYLLNPNSRAQKLDDLAFSEIGMELTPIKSLIGPKKNEITFDKVDIKKALNYGSEDADAAWRLYKHFSPKLAEAELSDLNKKIEVPLIPVLGNMEEVGVKVDAKTLNKLSKKYEKVVQILSEKIKVWTGESLNINSPAQLQEILFNKLKLQEKIENPKELKKLKNGSHSTSASELEKLKGTHPIIELILEYRELTKLKNTYIDVLPSLINKRTKRIHTSFNQAVTQTGRLSSSDPNLQNIPIRTEAGKEIRNAFVAEPGHNIITADYSQIELRIVAHVADVREMIKIFKEGRDIHTETAAKVYDVSKKEVTSSMRRIAKIINFGILYGVSPHGLKEQTGLTREEGKELIEKYFALYPEIKKYNQKMVAQAHELGYVETIFSRRRYLPEIKSSNFAIRGAAERMAVNMPIQGTAADLIKLAMIDIENLNLSEKHKTKMILQVHDELVFEAPKEDSEQVAAIIRNAMENVVSLNVPIKAQVSWAKSWGEAK